MVGNMLYWEYEAPNVCGLSNKNKNLFTTIPSLNGAYEIVKATVNFLYKNSGVLKYSQIA